MKSEVIRIGQHANNCNDKQEAPALGKEYHLNLTLQILESRPLDSNQEFEYKKPLGLELDGSISWRGKKFTWRQVSALPKRVSGKRQQIIEFIQGRTMSRLRDCCGDEISK